MDIENSQEAVKRAVSFFQQLGQPVDDVAHVEYVPVEKDDVNSYWKPQWVIEFQSRTQVHVDSSGTISKLLYMPILNGAVELSPPSNAQEYLPGPFLTESEATERAKSIFLAMKLPSEANLDSLEGELYSSVDPPKLGTTYWQFSQRRFFNGIPYLRQSYVIFLDAETGQLTNASLNVYTMPPLTSTVIISKNQAITLAENRLIAEGVKRPNCVGMKNYVVQPNGLFVETKMDTSKSYMAWVGFFEAADFLYVVYVDAQTGKILGGDLQSQ